MVSAKEIVQAQIAASPVVVYSKSYCPYCAKTKTLLTQLGAKYEVIELDQIAGGSEQQDALEQITGQSTVPNVFVGGKSIGGNSDVQKLHKAGNLEPLLEQNGALCSSCSIPHRDVLGQTPFLPIPHTIQFREARSNFNRRTMFRSAKPKKNKRRRVAEDEDEQIHAAEDVPVVPMASDRRAINTFSVSSVASGDWNCARPLTHSLLLVAVQTGGVKKAKNVVQTQLIESEREIVPRQYAGGATYETQIDTEKDRDLFERKPGLVRFHALTTNPISARTTKRQDSVATVTVASSFTIEETTRAGGRLKRITQRRRRNGKNAFKRGAVSSCSVCLLQRSSNCFGCDDNLYGFCADPDEESDEEGEKSANKADKNEQFACTICRGPFRNAVETTLRSYACGYYNSGVFNAAEKLRAKEKEQKNEEANNEDGKEAELKSGDETVETSDNASGGWTNVADSS
ncbi:unnamed protein product [Phytophthora lilii]|uniref:Unnamed protein product n=1 Tax=Phytophthora lilii TaxID=2077276 RepID=A0A9W6TXV0_9STRA|nr:unnamed protein product [Phytophthora lilii]